MIPILNKKVAKDRFRLWCYEERLINRGTPRYLGPGSLYEKHNAIYSYLRMYKGRYLSVWVAELAIFCVHKRVWPLFRSSVINGLQKRSKLHLAKRLPRANMNGITCFDHVLHVLIKIYLQCSFNIPEKLWHTIPKHQLVAYFE